MWTKILISVLCFSTKQSLNLLGFKHMFHMLRLIYSHFWMSSFHWTSFFEGFATEGVLKLWKCSVKNVAIKSIQHDIAKTTLSQTHFTRSVACLVDFFEIYSHSITITHWKMLDLNTFVYEHLQQTTGNKVFEIFVGFFHVHLSNADFKFKCSALNCCQVNRRDDTKTETVKHYKDTWLWRRWSGEFKAPNTPYNCIHTQHTHKKMICKCGFSVEKKNERSLLQIGAFPDGTKDET